MDVEAQLGSGLTRQKVPEAERKAADQVARLARRALQLGPGSAAGHLPDRAAGGSVLGPTTDTPSQVNSSFGGQWKRYKPGFVFTGFTVYDFETGKIISGSGRHFDEPQAMKPGAPGKGLTGLGAAASGMESASKAPPRAAAPAKASLPSQASSAAAPVKAPPPSQASSAAAPAKAPPPSQASSAAAPAKAPPPTRASSATVAATEPIMVGPSARGQAIGGAGLLALDGLNALLGWLGTRSQNERTTEALNQITPAISKHQKENPQDGALVVGFYHQTIPHPESPFVPVPIFGHLEYQFGATRDEAFARWSNVPSLRQGYGSWEREVRQFWWLPPSSAASTVKPQLEVGRIDDPAERQADDVADRVMLMREGAACCPACAAGSCAQHTGIEHGAAKDLRRKASGSGDGGLAVPSELEPQVRRATSGGETLPHAVRAFFEPRFGEDLSHVRIHRDADAAASAGALGAKAYALGSHIAFANGQYRPDSATGRRLLAHELTHVLQDRSTGGATSGPVRRDKAVEAEVKHVVSLEIEAQEGTIASIERQLGKRIEKRRKEISDMLTGLGGSQSKVAGELRQDLAKDLEKIIATPDSNRVNKDLRGDIMKSSRALEKAKLAVEKQRIEWGKYDAIFAGKAVASALGSKTIGAADLKALVGQESTDFTHYKNTGDNIAGIAQMGTAAEGEAGGKKDDRKTPEKAIVLAAKYMAVIAQRLDSLSPKPTGDDWKLFIMAAYNGGHTLVIKAHEQAKAMKRDATKWAALIDGKEKSPLYRALGMLARYKGKEDSKYLELAEQYIPRIQRRLGKA